MSLLSVNLKLFLYKTLLFPLSFSVQLGTARVGCAMDNTFVDHLLSDDLCGCS